jgi:hypothetical protein
MKIWIETDEDRDCLLYFKEPTELSPRSGCYGSSWGEGGVPYSGQLLCKAFLKKLLPALGIVRPPRGFLLEIDFGDLPDSAFTMWAPATVTKKQMKEWEEV